MSTLLPIVAPDGWAFAVLRATATTQGGRDVVLVDGRPFAVEPIEEVRADE